MVVKHGTKIKHNSNCNLEVCFCIYSLPEAAIQQSQADAGPGTLDTAVTWRPDTLC